MTASRTYERTCATCSVTFPAKGWAARYCPVCRNDARRDAAARARRLVCGAEQSMSAAEVESRLAWTVAMENAMPWERRPWPGMAEEGVA